MPQKSLTRLTLVTIAAAVLLLAALSATAQQPNPPTRGINLSSSNNERRVALVIGNSNYEAAPLRNPVNDANSTAATLRELGFDVIARTDVNLQGMKQAVREFSRKIQNGAVGLFYYAGHGMQSAGRNFLIPIGAQIEAEGDLVLEGFDLNLLLEQMGTAQNRLNIVILDACRNNPFARSFRSYSQGLAQVNAPAGTFIAYATAPGQTASDGKGQNGLYTQELLANMRTPGLPIEEVFKRVRVGVKQQSNGVQVPWDASSLEGSFFFVPGAGGAAQPPPAVAAQPQPAYTQPVSPPASSPPVSVPTRSTVSLELIESNYQSNLLDEVIKDGQNFLAAQPDHGRVNLRVGQSYFGRNMYGEAMPYLERAVRAGESFGFVVKRHRKSLGIFDDLENGSLAVGPTGLQLQFGGDTYQLPFAQIERLEAQADPARGMLIYLKGAVVNKKGKTEKKDYKLFAPSAGIVQMTNNAGQQIPVAVCRGCETWTAEVVKFINRSKTTIQ
ncbi:MAG TPA: caspase domain-containing protein [Pyrinomonadaceae bacterium]|nr:caspase domain-containing protein [Pyrinomonadaceae bacterium]